MVNKTLQEMVTDDATFWNAFTVPSGISAAHVTAEIMQRSGMLFPWLQDASDLKTLIGQWCAYRAPEWTRALTAMTETYNPIYNYFREELGSEEIAKHKGTKQSTAEDVTETPGVTMTNTGSVVAYDANAEAETGQSVSAPTGNNKRVLDPTKNYVTITDVDANTFDKDVHSFVNRVTQGNIGVTQNVDMILNELRLRFDKAIVERIAAEFESKFLMQVY